MVISLERALPAAALVVWEAETLPEAFAFVDPQWCLLHPGGHHRQSHGDHGEYLIIRDAMTTINIETWYPVWVTF